MPTEDVCLFFPHLSMALKSPRLLSDTIFALSHTLMIMPTLICAGVFYHGLLEIFNKEIESLHATRSPAIISFAKVVLEAKLAAFA